MKELVYENSTIPLVKTKDTRPETQIRKEGEQLFLKGIVPVTEDVILYTRRISSTPTKGSNPTLRLLHQFQSYIDVNPEPGVVDTRVATVNITVTATNDEIGLQHGKRLLRTAFGAIGANDCQEYEFTAKYSSLEQTDVSAAAQLAVITAVKE